MLILMHGTGDDDSKPENWMRWVAQIWEKHGELALTVPGVNSAEWDQVGAKALAFLDRLEQVAVGDDKEREVLVQIDEPDLVAAITVADGYTVGTELRSATQVLEARHVGIQYARGHVQELARRQRNEGQYSATGIKFRAAVAAVCAVAYHRRASIPSPIRIIGHSRGGATAIALHNLLTLYGIPCDYTLTLDPCHGQKIVGTGENYYLRVWRGTVFNIPVVREVGDFNIMNKVGGYTRRNPIAAAGSAKVTNRDPKLPTIKHGHMGKLQSCEGNNRTKQTLRADLQERIENFLSRAEFETAQEQLHSFFIRFAARSAIDWKDRDFILRKVEETLSD